MVERKPEELSVVGSIPTPGTTLRSTNYAWRSHDSKTNLGTPEFAKAFYFVKNYVEQVVLVLRSYESSVVAWQANFQKPFSFLSFLLYKKRNDYYGENCGGTGMKKIFLFFMMMQGCFLIGSEEKLASISEKDEQSRVLIQVKQQEKRLNKKDPEYLKTPAKKTQHTKLKKIDSWTKVIVQ